jgi:hypothetical protein
MNDGTREIRLIYRILAGVCSALFIIGLIAELLFAEIKSWSFIISGSVILVLFLHVAVYGKTPRIFRFLSKQ